MNGVSSNIICEARSSNPANMREQIDFLFERAYEISGNLSSVEEKLFGDNTSPCKPGNPTEPNPTIATRLQQLIYKLDELVERAQTLNKNI